MVLKLTLKINLSMLISRNVEIYKLLKKGVITKCEKEHDGFISTVFTKEKDGTFRIILNLKYLNEFVE